METYVQQGIRLGIITPPSDPAPLSSEGQRELDAYTARLVDAAEGAESFWHPDLPEVSVVHAHRSSGFLPRLWSMTREGTKPVVAALLFLLLPAVLQAQKPCKVNVNTASPAQLALLINTGPALAGKIEAARVAGPLDAAKLDAVPGVGVKWLEYNGPHVAYSGETTCTEKLRKPAATGETESDTVRKEASGGGQ